MLFLDYIGSFSDGEKRDSESELQSLTEDSGSQKVVADNKYIPKTALGRTLYNVYTFFRDMHEMNYERIEKGLFSKSDFGK